MDFKLNVLNVKCGGCANTITKRLASITGVSNVSVNEEEGRVEGSVENESNIKDVVDKLSLLGYPVSEEDNNAFKKAKSYLSCVIGRVS